MAAPVAAAAPSYIRRGSRAKKPLVRRRWRRFCQFVDPVAVLSARPLPMSAMDVFLPSGRHRYPRMFSTAAH
jgi:hypothetical protein